VENYLLLLTLRELHRFPYARYPCEHQLLDLPRLNVNTLYLVTKQMYAKFAEARLWVVSNADLDSTLTLPFQAVEKSSALQSRNRLLQLFLTDIIHPGARHVLVAIWWTFKLLFIRRFCLVLSCTVHTGRSASWFHSATLGMELPLVLMT
jgi:hypothetical protein